MSLKYVLHKKRKWLVLCITVIALLLCLLAVIPNAEASDQMIAVQELPYAGISAMFEEELDFMEGGIAAWDGGRLPLFTVTDMPYEGGICLGATANAKLSAWQTVKLTFDTPRDLSAYATLLFAARVPSAVGSVSLCADIHTANAVYSRSCSLLGTDWNTVFVDISDISDRTEVQAVEIGVRVTSQSAVTDPTFALNIDAVSLCRSTDLLYSLQFLTPDYYAYGGTLQYTEQNGRTQMEFTLSASAAQPFLETRTPPYVSFSDCDSLSIRLSNYSECDAIRIYYTTASTTSFSESNSYLCALSEGTDPQTVYIPLHNRNAQLIRIQFENARSGSIVLHSLMGVSFDATDVYDTATVDTCELNADGSLLTVSGTMDAEIVARYRSASLQLYALLPGENPITADFSGKTPIDSASVSEAFSFRVQATDQPYLSRAFAITLASGGNESVICDTFYITNPEIASVYHDTGVNLTTKKGIWGSTFPAHNADLGAQTAVIELNVASLFTGNPTDIWCSYNESKLYLNPAVLEATDRRIRAAAAEKLFVILHLTVSAETEASLSPIVSPSSPYGANGSFRTDDRAGTDSLFAACRFLAERYGTSLGGVICGSAANDGSSGYVTGKNTLSAQADAYTAAYRVMYNAFRSVNASLRIYVPFLYNADELHATVNTDVFASDTMLEAFCARMIRQLPVSFHIYWDIKKTDLIENGLTDLLTDLCTDLSELRKRRSLSAQPTVIIADHGITEGDAEQFIYAFLKLNTKVCDAVTAYLIPERVAYSMEALYAVIDTTAAQTTLDTYLDRFGVSSYTDLIAGYAPAQFMKRELTHVQMSETHTSDFLGNVGLFTFANGNEGWNCTSGSVELAGNQNYMGQTGTLYAHFKTSDENRYRAFTHTFAYPRDFRVAPVFSLRLAVASLPDGVRSADVEVILTSGNDRFIGTGEIRVGEWVTLFLDATEFGGIALVDSVTVRLAGTDGADIGEPTLVLASVTANSYEHTTEFIVNTFEEELRKHTQADPIRIQPYVVRSLIAAGGVSLLALLLRAYYRLRKKARTAPDPEKDDPFRLFRK